MKITHDPPSPEATRTLHALRKAVQQKLDEKRRLGHYYVVWEDDHAVFIATSTSRRARWRRSRRTSRGLKRRSRAC
jgi:hypothetical protein